MTKKVDSNGFWYIKHNPISKEGVFPYLGHTISEDCEPNKIYKVYRPAKTLQDSVETWDNPPKPFINDHEMLGEGFSAIDDRPVQGIIYNPVCEDGVLYADIAVYSEDLKRQIEDGKKELSLGYFCKYKKERGVFNGEVYDYVQSDMVGNHIALVDAGRCGSDVKVFDRKCTMDAMPVDGQFEQDEAALKKTTEDSNIESEEQKGNQMVDKRKFIDEIAAIAEKPVDEFKGGEEEKFRTIVGLLEKSEYAKSESGKADDEDDTEEKAEDKCGKDSDEDDKKEDKKAEDALEKLMSVVKDMADDIKKLVADKEDDDKQEEKAEDEDEDDKKSEDEDDSESDDDKKKSEDSAVFVMGADAAIAGDAALNEYLK